MMDPGSATEFLDGLTDYERLNSYRYDSRNFGLERMRRLLGDLGHPEGGKRFAVVAGTKGKGSTAAMLASILSSSGLRTGLYTSPHLIEYRERIRLDGRPLDPGEFAAAAGAVAGPVGALAETGPDLRPTTFEALTAMALVAFARAGCDAAVLEVGMGGRLDAVNAVSPGVVCVTPVSLDHMDQLGDTVPKIAGEKAGVIKGPVPVACAVQEPGALAVIRGACANAGARLILAGQDFGAERVAISLAGGQFDAVTPAGRTPGLRIGLLGRHQVSNAMVALAASEAWGLATPRGIREGLASARWPGRMQFMRSDPRILVDGAHNGSSASALASAVAELLPGRKVVLVLAMLRGKDARGVADALVPISSSVMLPALSHPRALPPPDLAALLGAGVPVRSCANPAEALGYALREAGPDGIVLCAGSLALAGDILRRDAGDRRDALNG
jgi:dihydrofolate synthase/folylpolyglutamate synthase